MRKTPRCIVCARAATHAEISERPYAKIKRGGLVTRGMEQIVTYWCNFHRSTT